MSIEEDVREIKTDLKWLVSEWENRPCEKHSERIRILETWRTFLAGVWAVVALLGWCAWDYLNNGRH